MATPLAKTKAARKKIVAMVTELARPPTSGASSAGAPNGIGLRNAVAVPQFTEKYGRAPQKKLCRPLRRGPRPRGPAPRPGRGADDASAPLPAPDRAGAGLSRRDRDERRFARLDQGRREEPARRVHEQPDRAVADADGLQDALAAFAPGGRRRTSPGSPKFFATASRPSAPIGSRSRPTAAGRRRRSTISTRCANRSRSGSRL